MLVRLETQEWMVVGRGLLVLTGCIIMGSMIVETQLNQLTYWQEYVQVFNFRRVAEGRYLAHIFGIGYDIQAVWQVGAIANTSHAVEVTLLGFRICLPTMAELDVSRAVQFLQLLWQQVVTEAFVLKKVLYQVWTTHTPAWKAFIHHAGEFIR